MNATICICTSCLPWAVCTLQLVTGALPRVEMCRARDSPVPPFLAHSSCGEGLDPTPAPKVGSESSQTLRASHSLIKVTGGDKPGPGQHSLPGPEDCSRNSPISVKLGMTLATQKLDWNLDSMEEGDTAGSAALTLPGWGQTACRWSRIWNPHRQQVPWTNQAYIPPYRHFLCTNKPLLHLNQFGIWFAVIWSK